MDWIEIVRWVVAVPLGLLWLAAAAGNGVSVARAALARRPAALVPLIGGLAGAAAFGLCPIEGTAVWAWVPLVADVGSLPALVAAGVATARRPPEAEESA